MDLSIFKERIQGMCKSSGISQKHLCDILKEDRAFLSNVFRGNRTINDRQLEILARELNTTVEYLTGETDNPNAAEQDEQETDELTEYLEELKTRPEMRILFSLAKGATKKDVEDAVKIIEALRNRGND